MALPSHLTHLQRVRSCCGPHFTLLVTLRHLNGNTKSSGVTWSLCGTFSPPHASALCAIVTRVKALPLGGARKEANALTPQSRQSVSSRMPNFSHLCHRHLHS